MRRYTKLTGALCLLVLSFFPAFAQEDLLYFNSEADSVQEVKKPHRLRPRLDQFEVSEPDLIKYLDQQPAFGVFKDAFFTTGIPLNQRITNETADAMFQVSIRQRLTKSYLPFNFFAYLTFSQKAFWDIYSESSPLRDINFNPGLGFGKYIIKDNKLIGATFIQIEHESNGKDGEDSRSWNYLSVSGKFFFNRNFNTIFKLWAPYVDGGENKDLLRYRGIGTVSANFLSNNTLWWITGELNPRKGFGNVNTTFTVGYKISNRSNQYLYTRFYNGRGDSLLNYKEYEMNIRIGICIKPDFYSVY
ncbi:MAG: phospholipase A [Tannerellaceae bacterium]|nr:phospholipase A [Tannerellaceae bacterium]